MGLGRGPEPSNGQLRPAEPLTNGVTGVPAPAGGEDASQQRSQLGTQGEGPTAHPSIFLRPGYLTGSLAGASKVCCCITKQPQTPQPKTTVSRFARVRVQEWPSWAVPGRDSPEVVGGGCGHLKGLGIPFQGGPLVGPVAASGSRHVASPRGTGWPPASYGSHPHLVTHSFLSPCTVLRGCLGPAHIQQEGIKASF